MDLSGKVAAAVDPAEKAAAATVVEATKKGVGRTTGWVHPDRGLCWAQLDRALLTPVREKCDGEALLGRQRGQLGGVQRDDDDYTVGEAGRAGGRSVAPLQRTDVWSHVAAGRGRASHAGLRSDDEGESWARHPS